MIHPLRDTTLKGLPNPALAYLSVSAGWVLLAGAQMMASGQTLALPIEAWVPAIVSALALVCYYYGTLAALRRGHLSVYYPIIRSSPLVIVGLNWAVFGQSYSALALIGVCIIIAAGIAIQKPSGRLFDDHKALSLALIAMAGSAVYTLADASAMQHAEPAQFLFWNYSLVTLCLGVVCLVGRRNSSEGFAAENRWPVAARVSFAAVSSYLSYYLILLAFQLNADPAYVGAIRQASIPVSVLLGALVLREHSVLHHLWWAIVLAIGIVILVTE